MMKFINSKSLLKINTENFKKNTPYDHVVINNFFHHHTAIELSKSFPNYNSEKWHIYDNAIENKKTINSWNLFNLLLYQVFTELNSYAFLDFLRCLTGEGIYPDMGLHGGGLHISNKNGRLNPHLDYSIHPKLKLQRKLNLIVYIEEDYKEEYGGHLGMWSNNGPKNRYGELTKKITPIFNRGVLFDTTQNSWHGICQNLKLPQGKYRKNLAIYYLQKSTPNCSNRTRAFFAPTEEQLENLEIVNLCQKRASEEYHMKVYRKNKEN